MREAQQRNGVTPAVQFPSRDDAHCGWAPLHRGTDAELIQQLKRRIVCLGGKVIKALDGDAVEVEVACHATGFRGCLDQIHFVSVLRRPVSSGQAHCTGSYNYDFCHPWRSSESGACSGEIQDRSSTMPYEAESTGIRMSFQTAQLSGQRAQVAVRTPRRVPCGQ